MFINGEVNKDVVHIAMKYYSAIKKDKIMPCTATQMDLDMVILREVCQRKANIVRLSLTCGI